jgi:hypothetical protein
MRKNLESSSLRNILLAHDARFKDSLSSIHETNLYPAMDKRNASRMPSESCSKHNKLFAF